MEQTEFIELTKKYRHLYIPTDSKVSSQTLENAMNKLGKVVTPSWFDFSHSSEKNLLEIVLEMGQIDLIPHSPIFVYIEEYDEMKQELGLEFEKFVEKLVLVGRSQGICVVLGGTNRDKLTNIMASNLALEYGEGDFLSEVVNAD